MKKTRKNNMKIRYIILGLIAFTLASCTHHIKKEYYPDGSLKAEYTVKFDTIIDGIYKAYYPDGKLEHTSTYVNGIVEGAYFQYYENDKIKIIACFHNDTLNGKFEQFWE